MIACLAGATAHGGSSGTNFTSLASFGTPSFNNPPGLNPLAELTTAPDGMLYGTTEYGGANSVGAIFKLGPLPASPSAYGLTPVTIASFGGTNGSDPRSPLTVGPDGNLYGTTYSGGAYGLGTVFSVTTNGELTTLASFDGTNGANPRGSLAFNTNYTTKSYALYGTAYAGGTIGNNGTLFWVNFRNSITNGALTNGVLSGLFSFDGATNGAQPWGGVTMGSDGNLYGTTATGGAYGGGTIFMYELTTGYGWGSYVRGMNLLYPFYTTDGTNAQAGLTLGSDRQTFYGTTFKGGTNNGGTIFSVSPMTNYTSVTVTTLLSFGGASGSNCTSRLLLGADNNLYGTAQYGGANNYGTVFCYGTNGSFSTLYSFAGGNQGYWPMSGLVQGTNGNFYGVTKYGGKAQNAPGTVYELWGFPPYIVNLLPTNLDLTIITNTSASLNVSVSGTAPLTYHWQRNTNNIGNSGTYSGANTTNLTITAGKNTNTYYYDVVVNNNYGAATSSVIKVAIAYSFGTNVPIVKITSPSTNKLGVAQATSLNAKVSGTATADTLTTVSSIFYSLNGSAPLPTPVSTKGTWSASVSLIAGTNIFQVYAEDNLGHLSNTNTLLLVPNLFVPVAGSYNGLFLNTNGVVNPTNAGSFNVKVSTGGSYSGSLQMAGLSYSMSGKLDTNGMTQAVAKNGKNGLLVTMWLDLTAASTQRIYGFINNSNDTWQADLAGDLSVFDGKTSTCPWTGKFNYSLSGTNLPLGFTNITLPGTNFSLASQPGVQPGAGSYGTITVATAGTVAFSGWLSDGTTCAQKSVPVSKLGLWPLYASLYKGQGLLWGWQQFPASGQANFQGDVAWIKPAGYPGAKYYTNGFTLRATPLASAYTAPTAGQNIYGSPTTNSATLIAIEGNLPFGVTNSLTISPKNQVANSQTGSAITKLSLSFVPAPGTFTGKFTDAASGQVVSFNGVMLQNTNATGFFLGTNQSGQVWLTAP